jgi:excisionase family DNA binding protein
MEDNLTTRQVQDILKVDRITVYRMLQDGRLKGVKIGQQWRILKSEVERLLGRFPSTVEEAPETTFPIHCIQTIQNLFSSVAQLSARLLNLQGEVITEVSLPCSICEALAESESGWEACRESCAMIARQASAGARHFACHAGLSYAGSLIHDRGEIAGLFLVGPFYWQMPDAGEQDAVLRRLAQTHGLSLDSLKAAADSIPVIQTHQRAQLDSWPTAAARAVESILQERGGFLERLQQIATLTQISRGA